MRELEASREVIRLKTLEEQKKSEQELALAQETQESLLPASCPSSRISVSMRSTLQLVTSEGISTIFRALCQSPESGEWMGVLADVSGKGMPAALLSSMVLGALSMEFRSGTQPQEVLNRVNRLLCEKSLPFQFVTLFLFLLNADGAGQYINAGHNPAYLFRTATGKIEKLVSDLYFLGMFDFASYQSTAFQLSKGDVLVVYSDGLPDAQNQQEEMFGEKRLLDLIRQEARWGSQALVQRLLKAIEEFTQGMPQTDDITFIVVEKLLEAKAA